MWARCHHCHDATVTPLCPQVPRGLRGAVMPAMCNPLRAGDKGTLLGDLLRLRLPWPLQHLRPRFWALPGKEWGGDKGMGMWHGVTMPPVPHVPIPPQNCQHNTEGPQCEKCKPGFFGDATKGTATACHPCPCPYTEPARRWVPIPGAPPPPKYHCPGLSPSLSPAGFRNHAFWTRMAKPLATPAHPVTPAAAARGGCGGSL